MKGNKIDNSLRRKRIRRTIQALALVTALGALCFAGWKIHALWLEQCVITDFSRQVSITDGKMLKASTTALLFGLKPGANLAHVDFKQKRLEALQKHHQLRDIRIVRHLPDRVTITVEERIPIARLNIKGSKISSNRLVDTEGVVFTFNHAPQTLPVIREPSAPGTPPGQRISDHTLAALRLLEICADQFHTLGVQEADASNPDHILLTLGNYSSVRISWDGMDEGTPVSRQSLIKQLEALTYGISTGLSTEASRWNATQPNQVSANPQKGFL